MVRFDEEKQEQKLAELRKKEEESLIKLLSDKYDLPYVDFTRTPIQNSAVGIIDEETARAAEIGIFQVNNDQLDVAVFSPNDEDAARVLDRLNREGYEVNLHMTTRAGLEAIWKRYADLSYSQTTEAGVLDASTASLPDIAEHTRTIDDVKKFIDQLLAEENATHKTSKLIEVMVAGAYSLDASDIHLEAEEEQTRVRYRLDGVLQDVTSIDPKTARLLLSRVKLLSGLKLNVEADTQDGRFSVKLEGVELQIRTSIIPSSFGESVVMRVLDPESITLSLEDLGMHPTLLSAIQREIKKPNGMILTTGPTGSGKTTTLYAFLREIYDPEIKIITIEDPVEYHLEGISQTQVDKESNYTFLSGLRAALRQDPDVIKVGEVRDEETAGIAINSALTGHLVLSTLHTNDAAGAIPRLIDLEVNPKVMGSAILATMAQRLVRQLCEYCAEAYEPPKEERQRINRHISRIAKKIGKEYSIGTLWRAVGCEKCNNTGYSGRIGVFEAVLMDEEIEKLITKNPSAREIARAAESQGILTMAEDGIIKVLDGVTALEELERVVDIGNGAPKQT